MAKRLSRTFGSLKPHSKSVPIPPGLSKSSNSQISPPSSSTKPPPSISVARNSSWAVYLILSTTNPPLRTYVGVTNNFSRRLKQHNGELTGGAKASRAGRPWICSCLVQGFRDKKKAYEFESKWKSISRKLPRRRSNKNQEPSDNSQMLLLQHRYAALNQVKDLIDCGQLEIDWHLDPI